MKTKNLAWHQEKYNMLYFKKVLSLPKSAKLHKIYELYNALVVEDVERASRISNELQYEPAFTIKEPKEDATRIGNLISKAAYQGQTAIVKQFLDIVPTYYLNLALYNASTLEIVKILSDKLRYTNPEKTVEDEIDVLVSWFTKNYPMHGLKQQLIVLSKEKAKKEAMPTAPATSDTGAIELTSSVSSSSSSSSHTVVKKIDLDYASNYLEWLQSFNVMLVPEVTDEVVSLSPSSSSSSSVSSPPTPTAPATLEIGGIEPTSSVSSLSSSSSSPIPVVAVSPVTDTNKEDAAYFATLIKEATERTDSSSSSPRTDSSSSSPSHSTNRLVIVEETGVEISKRVMTPSTPSTSWFSWLYSPKKESAVTSFKIESKEVATDTFVMGEIEKEWVELIDLHVP